MASERHIPPASDKRALGDGGDRRIRSSGDAGPGLEDG